MDWLKLLNILGIFLQIIGVIVLAKSDSLVRQIAVADDSIPGNQFIETFNAAIDGVERQISPEEKKRDHLLTKFNSSNALTVFRRSLYLVVLGMFIQLFVELINLCQSLR